MSEPCLVLSLPVHVNNKTILTIHVNVNRVRSHFKRQKHFMTNSFFESDLLETALNKINHHVPSSLTINYILYSNLSLIMTVAETAN